MRIAVVALLLALVSTAVAHPGDEFEMLSAQKGNITVYVTPQTLVVKAARDVVFLGEALALNGSYKAMRNVSWTVDAQGPGEGLVEAQPYGTGFAARVNFSVPGAWTLLVDANGTTVQIPLTVYRATSVHAESTSLRYERVYVDKPVKAGVYFMDDATGSLVRREATMSARIERWENGTKLDEKVVSLNPSGSTGEFTLEHTFAAEGEYLVRVESPENGIAYDDLPPFKVNVLAARFAEEPPRETPMGAALAVLAVGALALVARRR